MSTTDLSLAEFSTIAQACALNSSGLGLSAACELLAALSDANCEAVATACPGDSAVPYTAEEIEEHAVKQLPSATFGQVAHAAGKALASLVYNCDAQLDTNARRDALIAIQSCVMRALVVASPFNAAIAA